MRALFVAACASAALFAGGCFIFTGSTDGYDLAGSDSGAADGAATCAADATCVSLTCLGSGDCDGGVCCLAEVNGGIGSTCQTACAGPQFCKTSGDCVGGETCSSQSCTSNGVSLVVSACTSIPGCTQ